MANSSNTIRSSITANGQERETVKQFKYIGAIVNDEASKTEILARSAQTLKLKPIWRDKNIAMKSKMKLLHIRVLFIFLYACESWTLTVELQRKIATVERRYFRRILGISYTDHVTIEEICKPSLNTCVIVKHFDHSEEEEAEIVWACDEIKRSL